MRIIISPAIEAGHNEIRNIVRQGFKGERGPDIEVHVKGSWRRKFVPLEGAPVVEFKDGTQQRGRVLNLQGGFSGRACNGVPSIAKVDDKTRYLVTLKMPVRPDELAHRYPEKQQYRKSAPAYTVENWQSELLALAAHEAYHITQYRRWLPHSEVECERHAIHILTGQRCSHPRKKSRRRLDLEATSW